MSESSCDKECEHKMWSKRAGEMLREAYDNGYNMALTRVIGACGSLSSYKDMKEMLLKLKEMGDEAS